MKNKFLSFLAVFTCLCFCASPLCVGAEIPPVVIEILAETVFSYLLQDLEAEDGTPAGLAGMQKHVVESIFENALEQPIINPDTGEASFVLHSYDFVTGKYQMTFETAQYNSDWTVKDTFTKDILVEITMCLSDVSLGSYTDPNTGVTYWANGLNIAITRPENWITGSNIGGTVKHYFVQFPLNFDYSRQVTFTGNSISSSSQGGCTLYSVSGNSRSVMETNFYTESAVFTFNDENDITVSANSLYTPPTINPPNAQVPLPLGIISTRGSSITSPGLDLPIDKDICHGDLAMFFQRYNTGTNAISGSAQGRIYCNRYLSVGFLSTNNPTHSAYLVNNNVDNSQKNYYISNYQGGTIIDKDSDIGTKISPVFELDPSLPDFLDVLLALIPTLLELLDGDFLGDMAGLIGALVDFFSHMPDIGMEWNSDNQLNTNNYYEVDFPSYYPPDSGGGGTGGDITVNVTVDITRPLVTVYDYSDPVSFIELPVITTYTLPTAVKEQAIDIVSDTNTFFTDTGLIPIYGFLTLIGIGIAVIFKGV